MQFIEAAAPVLGVQARQSSFRDAIELVRAVDAFAAESNGGVLMLPPSLPAGLRETLIHLAFTANEAGRDAGPDDPLKHTTKNISVAEALVARA
jgi:hypothetical protein